MIDSTILSEGIKLAVAPVFLLTAVGTMIGSLTHRLSRVIDRARWLHKEISDSNIDLEILDGHNQELLNIEKRGQFINASLVFLVICGLLIGLTAMELFLSETATGKLMISQLVLYTFIGGVASFIFALISFLIEVLIAWFSIRWRPYTKSIKKKKFTATCKELKKSF
jgi:hypothetical protein